LSFAAYAQNSPQTLSQTSPQTSPNTSSSEKAKPTSKYDLDLTGCTKAQSLEKRNDVVQTLAKSLEALPKEAVEHAPTREIIGLFAAHLIPSDEAFSSIDRECWIYFYEAKRDLALKKEKSASEASSQWRDCIRAVNPDSLKLTEPIMACFEAGPSKEN
jgi:hypothetical protein